MFTLLRSSMRAFLGLLLAFALGSSALHAQLDPKLWKNARTDFLDLFQQSTSTVMKPEIVTTFDFSGSMAALMYHPAYYTTSPLNAGQGSNPISFTLGAVSSTYTLVATSIQNGNAQASAVITVGGGVGSYTTTGAKTASRITTTVDTFTVTTPAPPGPYNPGGNVTITVIVTIKNGASGARTVNPDVNWSGGGVFAPASSTVGPFSLAKKTTKSWTHTTTWTMPATAPSPITGYIGSPSGLTLVALVKPNGLPVTAADAAAANTGSGQNGTAAGASDVRNWIRAASHARFTNGSRTVDIPIPWKSMDLTSTGNPLSSAYSNDPVGGTNVELDRCYAINGGNEVLTANATTSKLWRTSYDSTYVSWLFNGKYQNTDATRPDYSTNYAGKYIVFDAVNPLVGVGVGGQTSVAWGQGFGTYAASDTLALTATKSVPVKRWITPARTRMQAVKEASVRTWLKYQTKVVWAYRELDTSNESGGGTGTTFNNDSKSYFGSNVAPSGGRDSGWTLLNGNSPAGVIRLTEKFVSGSTPITYAMARSLAQFSDPASVFNNVYDDVTNPVPQCLQHFVIFFTDGLDNNGGVGSSMLATPYIDSGTSGSADKGNQSLIGSPTDIGRNGAWWNLFTFAGAAAHMSDLALPNHMSTPILGYPPVGAVTPDEFLPFAINSRTNISGTKTTFATDHAITTMTVGVSLGGSKTDSTSSKYGLFVAAAIGDPHRKSWDIAALDGFTLKDDNDPTKGVTANSTYFFDATDPDLLVKSLDQAFFQATLQSNVNATTNPNLPYIGASFGKQVYLGKFQPPTNGGPVWPGDMLMFATKELGNQTVLLDSAGNPTSVLDYTTAQWSAWQALLNNRTWSSRMLYTRLPATTSTEPGLTFFSDIDTNPAPNAGAYTKIKAAVGSALLPAPTDSDKRLWIQFAAGADTDGPKDTSAPPRPTTNRATIMGDVINSSPAALEYNWSDVSGRLTPKLSAVGGNRFRLLLVGTNQGWLHAFGEVTKITSVIDSGGKPQEVVVGAVDELWSFMPTDFLPYLDHLKTPTNPHRFMVDGTPTMYHLDLPPAGGGSGNGVVDATERAMAIIGLRKGGRSYYALDIHDPFLPSLKWSLVPDEAAFFPSGRVVGSGLTGAAVQGILSKMGFSTAAPSLGRVLFSDGSTTKVKDAVFLGGGLSNPAVEANFGGTILGRSVMALDVWTGEVLAAKDLTATIGACVPAGLVPFEFILNSGMAQRAYFLDYSGGLWAWGSGKTITTANDPFQDFRVDSSDLAKWTADGNVGQPRIRKVAALNSVPKNALYSTLPAPFRVGYFPGKAKTAGAPNFSPPPAAVGLAVVSGDRNNPLDNPLGYTAMPDHFRLTVVFDRQDSRAWLLDTISGPDTGINDSTQLVNFTANDDTLAPGGSGAATSPIIPGSPNFYLAPTAGPTQFGYYVNFPGINKGFLSKGINEPIVVAGSLFYSYFNPTSSDPCAGGNGQTTPNLICDVLSPVVTDNRTNVVCKSGAKDVWAGVASNFGAYGTRGAIQGGVVTIPGPPPPPGTSSTRLELHTTLGAQQERFPKVRVWRTVH